MSLTTYGGQSNIALTLCAVCRDVKPVEELIGVCNKCRGVNTSALQQLHDWLKNDALFQGDFSRGWNKKSPGCEQAAYRNGMSWAFIEAMRKVEQLDPTIRPFGK